MSWGVDDVEVRALPLAKRRGRLDRDALFALQVHAVHFCANTVFAFHLRRRDVEGGGGWGDFKIIHQGVRREAGATSPREWP